MSKSLSPGKLILIGGGGLAGLLVLVAAAFLLWGGNLVVTKARFEAAAADTLGLEVAVGGPVEVSFFPGLAIVLKDVRLGSRGTDLVLAERIRLEIRLLPLLQKDVRISRVVLEEVLVNVERDIDGRFNFQNPEGSAKTISVSEDLRIFLTAGTIVYHDRQAEAGFTAEECRLEVRHFQHMGGEAVQFMQNLALRAELACGELYRGDFRGSDLRLSVVGQDGIFELDPVTMRLFGARGEGSVRADFSGAIPVYTVNYELPQFQIAELVRALVPQEIADGAMDFSAQLRLQGHRGEQFRQTLEGRLALRGKNLTFIGSDLDLAIARFEATQTFNLVDVGAFLVVGPVALVATRGYHIAGVFRDTGESSEIRELVSEWQVEAGVARARDVALATRENRLALQGELDFINEQFNDLTIALLDHRGCDLAQQKMHGSFREPVVEQPSILETLTGPISGLLQRGLKLLGAECDVFYTGSVAPPAN